MDIKRAVFSVTFGLVAYSFVVVLAQNTTSDQPVDVVFEIQLEDQPVQTVVSSAQASSFSVWNFNIPAQKKLAFLQDVPGGLGNYRSDALSIEELKEVAKWKNVKGIIRLNGNGRDSGGVSIAEERKIVEAAGLKFVKATVEGRSANIEKVVTLLDEGEWIVHCRHGFDRTGAAVGKHLRKRGFSKKAVIEHNRWQAYLEKGKRYQKYFSAIE